MMGETLLPKKREMRMPHKLAVQSVVWTDREKNELAAVRDGHTRRLQEKILIHNRTAADSGKHMIKPITNLASILECSKCGCNIQRMWLQNFMTRTCGKPKRGGTVLSERPQAKIAGRIATRAKWFKKLAEKGHDIKKTKLGKSIDEEIVHCRRCLKSMPWSKVSVLAASTCCQQCVLQLAASTCCQ